MKDLVFNTIAFPARETRAIVSALKADAFQLGTKQQYYIQVVSTPGYEQAVALICRRLFQEVPIKGAKRVLATLPKIPLK